ncbi:deoxyribonuclease TATDN1-like [Mercenaria mercenaria]|uniref:deoxyribonuclease TATDN1-like n=1 Tax=Mercenaria mercenaria TaxID=6596 RepID=UPI00234EB76C|nr:deoxyribonuclease TATDN1-like [Mercenaria mercenaria]
MAALMKNVFKFIDIGANLTDPVFRGVYRGKRHHEDDFLDMLKRAKDVGMEKIMVTAGCLKDAKEAVELVQQHDNLYTTIGCHPTRCGDFEKSGEPDGYMNKLLDIAVQNKHKVVAVGEFGLDYDRLQFCPKETQLKYFEKQFEMVEQLQLPLFLHSRAAALDFSAIIKRHRDKIKGGVVHSFTGTKEEAAEILDQGLYIGINGCSLKTQDNIDAMCSIPSDRIMIETDAPWCDIRNTHASSKFVQTQFPTKKKEKWEKGSMVKSRNEPATIIQVLEVLAAARKEDISDLSNIIFENTDKMFFGKET